jgi:hypothetical protein
VPFAVELFAGFQVDGTWNVPTTLTFAIRAIGGSMRFCVPPPLVNRLGFDQDLQREALDFSPIGPSLHRL